MTDVRLTATNPVDSSVVPVAANSKGELLVESPTVSDINNDVTINGNLTVTGEYIGLPEVDPGLPTGGEEGQVLSIMNGEPTWVFFEPPEPPPPENDVLLVDTRDQSVPGVTDYGMRNASGSLVYPQETWDEYIRSLPTWETVEVKERGLACRRGQSEQKASLQLPFSLDLTGNEGRVLEITAAYKWSQNPDNPQYAVFQVTTTNEHLTPVKVENLSVGSSGETYTTFKYLVGRPDLGVVSFVLQGSVQDVGTRTGIDFVSMQRFECVDSARLLMALLKEREQAQVPLP